MKITEYWKKVYSGEKEPVHVWERETPWADPAIQVK
jgi:hypothetical protein